MLNPLDYLPEQAKTRLVDGGLTKLADAADRAGSTRLAKGLRALRSDTPFLEDVSAGLSRAMEAFVRDWSGHDPELTKLLAEEVFISLSPGFLEHMAAILMRPPSVDGPEFESMRNELLTLVAGRISENRVHNGLVSLVAKVRNELFAHPKLLPLHSLFLQWAAVEGQGAILEALRTIHRDIALGSVPVESGSDIGRKALPPRSREGPEPSMRDPRQFVPLAIDVTTAQASRFPPDILTPTLDGRELIVPSYEPLVGKEMAGWLAGIQLRITASIENADFRSQEGIARELLDTNLELRSLEASAHYLLGEAQRLQADFTQDGQVRRELLNSAFEAYSTAIDLDDRSARALRGLGRIQEVTGDIGGALTLYGRARAAALHALTDGGDSPNNEVAHEVLRSTRHYAACISQVISDNPQSAWARESKRLQLHGLILESDDLHRTILPRFAADADWMRIEWFMGLVLLAKGYTIVGDMYRAWFSLLYALSARIEMMDPTSTQLSPIERGNLLWWCRTARSLQTSLRGFSGMVDKVENAVSADNAIETLAAAEDTLSPIRPPWTAKRGRK